MKSHLLKESQERRIYHLSESNAFSVFRFMRKFLSCQNMFGFFLRQKRRSAFSQDSLLSVILVIAVEQFVIDPMKHKSDCHWSSLRLWQQLVLLLIQKSINLYCNWSSSNMTNLKGRSGPMCDCRGIVLQAMGEGFGNKLGQQVTSPKMV